MAEETQREREKRIKALKRERVSKRDPKATRAALLKAAGEILAENGLSGFHVHDIAARAGYGKPLVYRYFGDRTQVLNALAQAKASEAEKTLKEVPSGPAGMNAVTYSQVVFARLLATDPVLRALFKVQLTGGLGEGASRELNKIIPHSGKSGDEGAAEAFLTAGISYILMLRDSLDTCSDVPIQSPNDLAAFERAFVKLSSQI